MEHVRWTTRPHLRRPVLIAAFEGWNDAGDASSNAVRWLHDRWDAEAFAHIDPEEFFDFSVTRPRVQLVDGMQREIVWPGFEFSCTTIPGTDIDVVLLLGSEPQLRWRTFCGQVADVAAACGVRLAVTLGALLADVSHAQPVSVIGTAYDATVVAQLGLTHSTYEGPTGIVGVLHDALGRAGLPSASFWAAVPSYVPGAPSPKAQLALIERTADLLEIGVVATDLEIAASTYERQITELVEADEDTAAYVRRLEADDEDEDDDDDDDEEEPDPDQFVAEVERFLRDHHQED
jgi:proteasome assembly chaperone (PAC2) family protein